MREVIGSAIYKGYKYNTMRDMLFECCDKYSGYDAFIFRRNPALSEQRKSFFEFKSDIMALAAFIMESEFCGDKFAVVGDNSYEWFLSYSGILVSDSTVVPLDRALPEIEIINLLERSEVRVLFYHPKHHELVTSVINKLDVGEIDIKLQKVVCMYADGIGKKQVWPDDDRFVKIEDWISEGNKLLSFGNKEYFSKEIDPDAVRIILFTSGTTAMSKGVMLTNRNIMSNISAISTTLDVRPGERDFSILPLHHTFENTCDFFVLSCGACICVADGLRYIVKNITEWHVETMISVPLLYENIYNKIMDGIAATPRLNRLVKIMIPITSVLRKIGIDIRRVVFAKVIDKLGGHLRLVVIGGAALDKKYVKAFNDFGIDFLVGYGLTETSPVISVTTTDLNVYGSVGKPISDVKVRIFTEDSKDKVGEIQTKSESVFKGYYKNEEATKQAFTEDGWFCTGDMGYLDKKDCIHVTGRVKSMIVLANGKKAFPEEIEALVAEIVGVSEVFVWGYKNDKEQIDISAYIEIDRKAIDIHLGRGGEISDTDISNYLDEKLRDVNHQMPAYKGIKYFMFTENEMIKTTTLKIKRPKQQEEIENKLKALNLSIKDINKKNFDLL